MMASTHFAKAPAATGADATPFRQTCLLYLLSIVSGSLVFHRIAPYPWVAIISRPAFNSSASFQRTPPDSSGLRNITSLIIQQRISAKERRHQQAPRGDQHAPSAGSVPSCGAHAGAGRPESPCSLQRDAPHRSSDAHPPRRRRRHEQERQRLAGRQQQPPNLAPAV